MTITSVDQWSETANLNTDVNGHNIAENCSPAGLNNAMRDMMAQIAATPLAETAATMRTNLGVSATADTPTLVSLEGLSLVAGDILYATAADTLARHPRGTALQYLQQNSALTAPQWVTGREVLTATRTYYVRTDGSDSNTGLINSAGGAFLTLQKAVTTIQALDRSIYDVTASIGAGTFTGGVSVSGWGPGTGSIYFTGAGATTIISTTSATCIFVSGGAKIIPAQMKLQTTTGGNCIHAYGGFVTLGAGIEFGACAGTAQVVSQSGGTVEMDVAYTISGNATYHLYCDNSSIYTGSTKTVTASGARAFTTFAVSIATGVIFGASGTYSGTFTGTRYSATLNSVINTFGGGANYFPGNVAGSTATGGQYA